MKETFSIRAQMQSPTTRVSKKISHIKPSTSRISRSFLTKYKPVPVNHLMMTTRVTKAGADAEANYLVNHAMAHSFGQQIYGPIGHSGVGVALSHTPYQSCFVAFRGGGLRECLVQEFFLKSGTQLLQIDSALPVLERYFRERGEDKQADQIEAMRAGEAPTGLTELVCALGFAGYTRNWTEPAAEIFICNPDVLEVWDEIRVTVS
jgi:hypothetical protein